MSGLRVLTEQQIASTVEALAMRASVDLPEDVENALRRALEKESSPRASYALNMMVDNARIARQENLPLCQDTGLFHLFIELGEGVALPPAFQEAANQGLRAATEKVPLRSSVVDDPLFSRDNRGDNTPVLIHVEEGGPEGKVRLTIIAKGGGSENATRLFMLLPGDGASGLKARVLATIREKAAHACPPVVVGVGVGADAAGALELALRALLRPLGSRNQRGEMAELEAELLQSINRLGIGAAGLGGDVTALGVHVEEAPAHIACMPVGMALCCHSLRRCTTEV
jgi:fumarate hydratase subunit alpha